MNPKQEKALIAGNNQGSKSNKVQTNYKTTTLFFHLTITDFPTKALIKVGVNHAN